MRLLLLPYFLRRFAIACNCLSISFYVTQYLFYEKMLILFSILNFLRKFSLFYLFFTSFYLFFLCFYFHVIWHRYLLSKDFMIHFAFLFFHFRIHLFPVQRRSHLSRFDVSRFFRFSNKQAHFSFPGRYDRVCPILLFCSSHFQAGLLDPQGKVFIDIFLCRKYNVRAVLISITNEVCYDS